MIVLWFAVCAAAGYLLGSFNGAILISRWFRHEDIRSKGSGNAGLTNFYRNYGGPDTLLVLLIDIGKTVLACFLGGWIIKAAGFASADPLKDWTDEAQMLCGGFSVIGHVFPLWFGFKGGKGILTCAALAAFMGWEIIAILLGIFIILVIITRYVSLGSIIACTFYPFLFWWRCYRTPMLVILAFCLAALAIGMHHSNIKRLLNGTESKFSFKKKKNSDQAPASADEKG
jgi:glycerol-3-phosphate acyltransferase PlsY